jgi:hypothetical protein
MDILEFLNFFRDAVDPAVKGWFYEQDIVTFFALDAVQAGGGIGGDLCELGCFQGKSAIALGRMRSADQRLFLFDQFTEVAEDAVRATLERFCPGIGPVLTTIPGDLRRRAAPPVEVAPGSLRLLHIDALHDHDGVLNDLRNFAPLVGTGGIVVLDDYFDCHFPGVATGMAEFCLSDAGRDLRPFASTPTKMYLCHRPWVPFYQRWLVRCGAFRDMSLTTMFDGRVLVCFSKLSSPPEALASALDAGP